MSQEPNMMEQRWDIGVEAAYAANEARDQLVVAEQNRLAFAEVVTTVAENQLPGVAIDPATRGSLETAVSDAKGTILEFENIVGLMIGRQVLGEDFGQEAEIEPVVVPEVDKSTTEKLETLPAGMTEQVIKRYTHTFNTTEANIREGKLSPEYVMPEMSAFVESIVELAPTFEAIEANGGQPVVEFFERGLTDEMAHATLTGHKLADDQLSDGVYRTFNKEKLFTPEGAPKTNDLLWGVVVIDAAEKPAIRGISADGKNAIKGVKVKDVINTLKTLPDVTETDDTEIIVAQASPSEDAYRGVQRRRLERGETPLDAEGWTIGKENINWGDGSVGSAFFYWRPNSRQVYSYDDLRGGANDGGVVRLSGER